VIFAVVGAIVVVVILLLVYFLVKRASRKAENLPASKDSIQLTARESLQESAISGSFIQKQKRPDTMASGLALPWDMESQDAEGFDIWDEQIRSKLSRSSVSRSTSRSRSAVSANERNGQPLDGRSSLTVSLIEAEGCEGNTLSVDDLFGSVSSVAAEDTVITTSSGDWVECVQDGKTHYWNQFNNERRESPPDDWGHAVASGDPPISPRAVSPVSSLMGSLNAKGKRKPLFAREMSKKSHDTSEDSNQRATSTTEEQPVSTNDHS
jgi:hypothetical protein